MKNKFKVLIGDDTLNFGIICGELLEKREFETVVTPKDGIKVFEAIQSTHPEVVIMDSSMPHIDALGYLKKLFRRKHQSSLFYRHQCLRQSAGGKRTAQQRCFLFCTQAIGFEHAV